MRFSSKDVLDSGYSSLESLLCTVTAKRKLSSYLRVAEICCTFATISSTRILILSPLRQEEVMKILGIMVKTASKSEHFKPSQLMFEVSSRYRMCHKETFNSGRSGPTPTKMTDPKFKKQIRTWTVVLNTRGKRPQPSATQAPPEPAATQAKAVSDPVTAPATVEVSTIQAPPPKRKKSQMLRSAPLWTGQAVQKAS